MSNDTSKYKELLKELYFRNDKKIFTNKKYIPYEFKDCNNILSNIASQGNFKEIKHRYKINIILKKILLQSQYNFVLYSFYRNQTLYIATQNHIGQSELNLQKLVLLHYFSKIDNFKDIKKVSIFRDDKVYAKETIAKKVKIYDEKSYGIFINNLTNQKLHKMVENIRKHIIDNQ